MCWLPTKALRSHAQQYAKLSSLDPIIGVIYGVYTKLYVNQVLWFFTCLFCTVLLFYLISRIQDNRLIFLIIIFLGIIGPYIHEKIVFRLPWNIELSFVAIVFFSMGHYLYRSQFLHSMTNSKIKVFVSAGLIGILILVVKINGWVNMNRMIFGSLALFYLGAFSGIGLTILLSQMIPKTDVAQWLSVNTIVIFPLHVIFFNIFTGAGVMLFDLDHSFRNSLIFSILYIVAAILACIPAAYIIRRYVPWMIGQKRRLSGTVKAQIPQMQRSSHIRNNP
jgi:acyltransferase